MSLPVADTEFRSTAGRDPAGRPTTWLWRPVASLSAPGSALVNQTVELHDGMVLVRKSLPADVRSADHAALAERSLDNEIRALVRLYQCYPAAAYPPELPRLVGYDFDSEDPFVLLQRYVGMPGGGNLRTLLTEERRRFMVHLLRGLAQLAAVDLVHGDIGLPSLCWNGSIAQLIDFERAAGTGEPAQTGSAAAVADTPPSQPADDVAAAGAVLFQLFTGRRPTRAVDMAEEAPGLAGPLHGVFDPDPTRRPTAAELLARLSVRDGLPVPVGIADALRAGRARFDQLRPPAPPPAMLHQRPQRPQRPQQPQPRRPKARPTPPRWQLAVVVLLVVAVLVVVAVVVR